MSVFEEDPEADERCLAAVLLIMLISYDTGVDPAVVGQP